MKHPKNDSTPDKENNPEASYSEQPPTPYLGYLKRPLIPIRPTEKTFWPYRSDPRRVSKTSTKEAMKAECLECTCGVVKEIRDCGCYGCPLWSYRANRTKIQRALLGKLRKNESFAPGDAQKLIRLKQSVENERVKILQKVDQFCSRQRVFFEKAYGGKSRVSAIKAYGIFQANFDLAEVESLEGGEH